MERIKNTTMMETVKFTLTRNDGAPFPSLFGSGSNVAPPLNPPIGHLKDNKRLDKNRLKGSLGDALNVLFSAAGLNFAKLFKAMAALPTPLHVLRFFVAAFCLALGTISGSYRFKKVLFQ